MENENGIFNFNGALNGTFLSDYANTENPFNLPEDIPAHYSTDNASFFSVTSFSQENNSRSFACSDGDGSVYVTETSATTNTVDGVTTEETTYHTETIVLTPDMSFEDVVQQYGLIQNENTNYSIEGRFAESEQSSELENLTSYTPSVFFDVGYRNGYLSNFANTNGVINFVNNAVNSYLRQNDYVSFNMDNETSFQVKTDTTPNEIFQYSVDGENISYAKLGFQDAINTFVYESGVDFYSGGNFSDMLKVVEDAPREIYLNGERGVTYVNINDIDASESTGDNQLVGNSSDNEIHAGSGNTLLWGGGGNDSLFGGSGFNTFWYGVNEGHDIIYNSNLDDTINLHNVSLSDIVFAKEIGDNMLINMADGGSLRIVGQNGASHFNLADGSSYTYDRETHTWTQNSQVAQSEE